MRPCRRARTMRVVGLLASLLVVACVEEPPPRPECFDSSQTNECDDDNVCEGNRCVADRRWALWRLPPSAPGAENYEIRDDTVLDKTTGLIWERGHSTDTAVECGAALDCVIPTEFAYCDELNIAGGGWRVPERMELFSIIDFTRFDPAIDPIAFPDTPAGSYSGLSFRDGNIGDNVSLPYNGMRFMRCVKASRPAQRLEGHYAIDGETVVDTQTQLRWVRVAAHDPNPAIGGEDGEISTLQAARVYCSTLTTGGFSDWRLPWIREVLTLIDGLRGFDDAAFPGEDRASAGMYFSATPYAPDRSRWWAVDFQGPRVYGVPENAQREVRCVRDEPVVVSDAGL